MGKWRWEEIRQVGFLREAEIGVGTDLLIKCVLYLLKTFLLSPQYPVCPVAALTEPASAKSNAKLTNFYTRGHYSNRSIARRSTFLPSSNCLRHVLPLFILSAFLLLQWKSSSGVVF